MVKDDMVSPESLWLTVANHGSSGFNVWDKLNPIHYQNPSTA